MAGEKKLYKVREGFVMVLKVEKSEGVFAEKTYNEGDEVLLTPEDYALHAHKLELAKEKDREAAIAAETAAQAQKAASDPLAMFSALLTALTTAAQAGNPVNLLPAAGAEANQQQA